MGDVTTGPLAALGAHLGARGFAVDLTAYGLRVTDPEVAGCCEHVPHVPHATDTISCRARRDDGGRMWFFTSWGKPVAEAERIIDAAPAVRGSLRRRAGSENRR
ncbi:hypothetical protein [Spirillospora sp. NPDC029432]|uniref:hypothetical protein n=1 Tax=Spirillospora sp. NPDC029432 TaxID=3154599 RepID=UPI0034549EBF